MGWRILGTFKCLQRLAFSLSRVYPYLVTFFWNLLLMIITTQIPCLWGMCYSVLETSAFKCHFMETLPSKTSIPNMLWWKLASCTPWKHSYPVTVAVKKCKQTFIGNALKICMHDTKKSILTDFSSWIKGWIWNHIDRALEWPNPKSHMHVSRFIQTHACSSITT